MQNISHLIVPSTITIAEAQLLFDANNEGILVICKNSRILGIVTDGNFRKFYEQGAEKASKTYLLDIAEKNVVTCYENTSDAEILEMMHQARGFMLLHIPVVNANNKIVGLKTLREIKYKNQLPVRALIMAGGFGARLGSLTEKTPKPMLKINDKPILEIIIDQFKRVGITQLFISTHYLPEVIRDYFKTGKKWGVQINYINEDEPLGTGGSLGLLPHDNKPTLVMNGDILSSINLTSFVEKHLQNNADITVATRAYDMQVPYGVIKTDEEENIIKLVEKPTHRFFVNSGIYIISSEVQKAVVKNKKIDITDIIEESITNKKIIKTFVLHEAWLDIGQPKDFALAEEYYHSKLSGNK